MHPSFAVLFDVQCITASLPHVLQSHQSATCTDLIVYPFSRMTDDSNHLLHK